MRKLIRYQLYSILAQKIICKQFTLCRNSFKVSEELILLKTNLWHPRLANKAVFFIKSKSQ